MKTSDTARESSGIFFSFSARFCSSARSTSGSKRVLTDSEPCGGTSVDIVAYGRFGVLYSTSSWNGSQMVSKPTNPFSVAGFWRVVKKRAWPSGTLVIGFCSLLISHLFHLTRNRHSNRPHARRIEIRLRGDRPARSCFFISWLAHSHNREAKDDLSAAKRIIAVDSQCLVVDLCHDKTARLPLVVFHEDRGANLPVLLGNVLDTVSEDQRLVPGAEDAIAVDRNLDNFARGPALELRVYERRQNIVVSVDIAQRKFNRGENVSRLFVDHLVGELDIFAIVDRFNHV